MFIDHQKALKDLLEKDMNRKEFLIYIGGAIIGVIGVTSFIENLLHQPGKKKQATAAPAVTVDGSYGGGGYSASSSLRVKG